VKTVAWVVYLTFIGLSVVGNILHSGNDPISMFLGGILPVALALATFLIEHGPRNVPGNSLRLAGTAVVAAGCAVVSFLHLYGLTRDHGGTILESVLTPLAFDGIMLVASLTIKGYSHTAQVRRVHVPRRSAWVYPAPGYRVLTLVPAVPGTQEHAVPAEEPAILPGLHLVPAGEDHEEQPGTLTPDAVLLRERYGNVTPTVREIKADLGWGTTRAGNARRELSA
jgi:uncharacterized protein YjeT (DUF2065 family)